MREEVIFPYGDLADNILVRYRESQDSDGTYFRYVNIYHKIEDLGFYPIDTDIFIVDSIGINLEKGAHFLAGSGTTIKMYTTLWP